jgi:hypothetical protein
MGRCLGLAELHREEPTLGGIPRAGEANDELAEPEQLFGAKYAGGAFAPDGRHAWLQVVPEKIVSWDFRKMGLGVDIGGTPAVGGE